MKIRNVFLDNFRQFYGEQKISFSVCPIKRVTVIHAENTYGKTTLLNAVLWCFYEQTTAKFENKFDVINWDAARNKIKQCSVAVELEHMDNIYYLKRTYYSDRKSCDFQGFKVIDGNFQPLPSPYNFISSVVPGEMAKYFFFDGEAAESFSAEKNHTAIAAAIKAMFGCALAERAIKDLKEIDRRLTGQMPKGNGRELTEIKQELETAEEALERLEDKITQTIADAEEYGAAKDHYAEQLRDSLESKRIQNERQTKKEEKNAVDLSLERQQKRINDWINDDGLSLLARRAAEVSFAILNEASLKGKVPSPFNEDLVNSILEDHKCICGRPVEENSEAWITIISLLESATKKEMQNKMIMTRSHANKIIGDSKRAHKNYKDIKIQLSNDKARRDHLEQKINELSKRLANFDDEKVSKLERARQTARDKQRQLLDHLVVYKIEKDRHANEAKRLEALLEKKAKANQLVRRVITRKTMVKSATEMLQAILSNYQNEARSIVESKVNQILDSVSHNHRKCRFNEDFSLELIRSDGRPCAKSSGESQLLSLVFMAALVEFSAARVNEKDVLLKPGAVAPLVLDSPFGQLDATYQQETAACLPKFAEQVVLFVSSTQGNSSVLEVLEPHIGSEYVLISHSAEPQGDKAITSLERRGETINTKVFSSTCDKTEIKEVLHACN